MPGDHLSVLTPLDQEFLREILLQAMADYSQIMHVPLQALSRYTQSELAILSRISYDYLICGCSTTDEKREKVTQIEVRNIAEGIAREYQFLTDYRYSESKKGLSSNSDLSFSIEMIVTRMIGFVAPLATKNPPSSLMPDLFEKFFSQALGLLKMLNLNLAAQAYSIWRTLHEAECVIKLLVEGGKELQDVYYRHIIYNNAFHHVLPSKEETDALFVEIKANMAKHGLKSKDMKKYIEYGWLYGCKTFHEDDVNYKLNFRNGLQLAADLGQYNEMYEMASEVAHSSPFFFYSNTSFYEDLTIYNLTDIVIRGIDYLSQWKEEAKVPLDGFDSFQDVFVRYLKKQNKAVDENFYTKYKDFIIEEDDSGDGK